MMNIEFKPLNEVDPAQIVALMNHPRIRRHLPLLPARFNMADCRSFLAEKAQMWSEHGVGPWAIVDGCQLVGWGGLQPEAGDLDLALVLHPRWRGAGRLIIDHFIAEAIANRGSREVTMLLPTSRRGRRALSRLGFEEDGARTVGTHTFIRFRLRSGRPATEPATTS